MERMTEIVGERVVNYLGKWEGDWQGEGEDEMIRMWRWWRSDRRRR